ncbi:hypothetical protein GCM10022237_37000 [Nocardioides ginsengisoli]
MVRALARQLPQGHGLLARTSIPPAGRVIDSSLRAMVMSAALERLAQRLDDVLAEERELVEEEHAAVRPRQRPGVDPAEAAADDARLARIVMGRGEGRADHHPPPGVEDSRERVEGGELEGLLRVEVGQDRGQPFGEAGLSAALRPREQDGVPAGRGDLDGVLLVEHPAQVGEVELLEPLVAPPRDQLGAGDGRDLGRLGDRLVGQHRDHLGERADPDDVDVGHHPGLGDLRLGDEDTADPALGRGEGHREHADRGPQPAGEGELADEQGVDEMAWLDLGVGGKHAQRHGEVELGAGLGEVGGREQDRGPLGGGPGEAAVGDRHPHPVDALAQGGVGAADDGDGGGAGRDVDLDVDEVAEGAVERDAARGREGHQHSPRT